MSLNEAVEQVIEESTGEPARIVTQASASGGSINDARVIQLEDGRKFFLKSNSAPLPQMFPREADGLNALTKVGAIRVPRALGTGGENNGASPFIVMEHITQGSPIAGFYDEFGGGFARLHKESAAEKFGFDADNYIGSTPQKNSWNESWVEFWRENRLGYQLKLARQNGYSDKEMEKLGDKLMNRLESLIGDPDEPPCLLHGDLWSGNYLADDTGKPVLIDPATYYGCREADLAMTMLFGGFNRRFYKAYNEVWPLADGSSDRIEIYKLYHLLNHLNLFGSSYYGSSMSILRRFA